MDRMLYVAMSGAKEMMTAQSINSNNLANASTTGFKADFHSALSHQAYGAGYASRVYATTQNAGVNMAQGSVVTTGRELDMAINGEGWFAVQGSDGKEAYSRAGDLRLDSLGRITNGAGYTLLGNGGPISVPEHAKLEIGEDGTISIQPLGQPVNTLATVDRIKMVNPANSDLIKGEDGLMRLKSGQPAQVDGQVRVVSGALESSNVNTVGALVKMIELARQYEHHVKIMQTVEENDRASAQIMKMS